MLKVFSRDRARARRGPVPGGRAAAVAAVAALLASLGAVAPQVAQAQGDVFATPVEVTVDAAKEFFVVVTSTDGALEVITSGTTVSPRYPDVPESEPTCSQRVATPPAGSDCFTSDGSSTFALGFRGTGAQVTAALQSLTFSPGTGVDLADAEITVSLQENPAPGRDLFFNPSNGHFYEVLTSADYLADGEDGLVLALESEFPISFTDVELGTLGTDHRVVDGVVARKVTPPGTSHVTWRAARLLAAARPQVAGQTGYLATITSLSESAFLTDFGPENTWIGASDWFEVINESLPSGATLFGDQIDAEGQWHWVTGPEAGTRFFSGAHPSGAPVEDRFSAWQTSEPNNSAPGEHFAVLNYDCVVPGACTATQNWNDFPGDFFLVDAFLVEFGPFTDGASRTSIEVTYEVPELVVAGDTDSLDADDDVADDDVADDDVADDDVADDEVAEEEDAPLPRAIPAGEGGAPLRAGLAVLLAAAGALLVGRRLVTAR